MLLAIYLCFFIPLLLFIEYHKKGFVGIGGIVIFATVIIFPGFVGLNQTIISGIFIYTFVALILDYSVKSDYEYDMYTIEHPIVNLLGIVFILVILADILVRVISAGSIINALLVNRLDNYLSSVKQVDYLTMFINILFPFGYMYIGSFLSNRKKTVGLLLLGIITLWLVFTSNTRFAIVIPILAFALLKYKVKVKSSRVKSLLVVILVVPLSVPLLNAGSYLRHGEIDKVDVKNLIKLESINNELKYNDWSNDLVFFVDKTHEFRLGYDWFIIPIINFVPRAIWPEKPLTSISNTLSEEVYLADIGAGDPVTTFTIFGEAYWQFWYLGFIILPIITFSLFRAFLILSSQFFGGFYLYSIFLIKYFSLVRAETPIFQLIYILLILFLLRIYKRIKV